MPGNLILKPLEANITKNVSAIGKMSPYFVVALGESRHRGPVCKNGGKAPKWENTITLENPKEQYCVVEVKTKRPLLPDKTIGSCQINVNDLNEEKTAKWYDIIHKNKVAGKIYIEASLFGGEGRPKPSATQSANVLEEKRREGEIYASDLKPPVSLDNIVDKNSGYEVRVIQAPDLNDNGDMHSVEKHAINLDDDKEESKKEAELNESKEKVKHADDLDKIESMEVKLTGDVQTENVESPAQRDSVFGDGNLEVPMERTEEEGLMGRVKIEELTRQR